MLDIARVAKLDPIRTFATSDAPTKALWMRPAADEALVDLGSVSSAMMMGGFAFDPLAQPTSLWDGFGEQRFTRAPRLGLAPDAWQDLVAEVASGIRTGALGLRKVVLARAQQVRVHATLEAALQNLATAYPSCTIFAFATGGACFLGATPERLVSLRDGTATTMALAGSAPRGATPEEDRAIGDRLLNDPKERTEQAIVADFIREALAPVSTRLISDAEPRLERLVNVQHLMTPIRAQVAAGVSVLDLVRRLHPTPAVGGYPREQALQVLREHEALDRGWYAAPFGWVNAQGEGEFVVGLRSALVRGDTATLFAGCGIVADSDPAREYAEWGWKLRPMLSALAAEV